MCFSLKGCITLYVVRKMFYQLSTVDYLLKTFYVIQNYYLYSQITMQNLRKLSLLLLLQFIAVVLWAQKVEKVINNGIYKSYFSYEVMNPLYVTYTLKNGGGPCDRKKEGFNFKKCGEKSAGNIDYTNSGYERGHLANAEDFAYNCADEEKTFCYYNAVPQTGKLNRGKWLSWEFKIREMSQGKSIFIIAGSIFGDKLLKPGSNVRVPDYCYKIVIDPKTGGTLVCLLFKNDDSDEMETLTLAQLKARLKYPLLPEKDLKLN